MIETPHVMVKHHQWAKVTINVFARLVVLLMVT